VLLVIEKQVTIARFMGQLDVHLFAFSAIKTQAIALLPAHLSAPSDVIEAARGRLNATNLA
jgi:hypothetical protein